MELNERDIDWSKDAPTLGGVKREIPFTVPSDYFTNLSDNLKGRILAESLRFKDEDEFITPPDYFDQLSTRIQNRISLETIKGLAPTDGFSVPDGYFSTLPDRINSKLERAEPIKSAGVRNLFSSWISYSAAACITLMIGSVIYLNSSSYKFSRQLSEVPDQEIINYLQVHSTASDTPYIIENLTTDEFEQVNPDVSSEELEQYINNSTL